MKKLLLVVSAALITGSIAFAQGSVEKTVLDLEHQWGKAVTASNGKALEPLEKGKGEILVLLSLQ